MIKIAFWVIIALLCFEAMTYGIRFWVRSRHRASKSDLLDGLRIVECPDDVNPTFLSALNGINVNKPIPLLDEPLRQESDEAKGA
ncbi:hypothetical protein H6783_01800 [Candidatus Nomurabacteria bacterium]|nr:hypothetical protein [Candidatus Nomurabacteria bacterium]